MTRRASLATLIVLAALAWFYSQPPSRIECADAQLECGR